MLMEISTMMRVIAEIAAELQNDPESQRHDSY